MTDLISNWVTIAMAGETIDGREIEEQWLDEIADSYDPSLYEASINADHFQIGLRYGRVAEVRTSEHPTYKQKTLQARIIPNSFLMDLNKHKQKLHTSCELTVDFPITGGAYLTGLALTDQPASLGTDRLEFSKQSKSSLFTQTLQLDSDHIPFRKNTSLNRLGAVFGADAGIQAQPEESPETDLKKENNDMTPEEFRALIKEELSAFKDQDTKEKTVAAPEPDPAPTPTPAPASTTETAPSAEAQDYSASFKKMDEQLSALVTEIKKLSAAVPSTEVPDNTGAVDVKVI